MIKKEARILGLAAASGRLQQISVIGIVFRGNLWLDGIFTCQIRPEEHDCMAKLVSAIVQSKQYSQIHAVILPREVLVSGVQLDISDFSHRINLPVISIATRHLYRKRPTHRNLELKSKIDSFSIRQAGGMVPVKVSGISREETREIFAAACVDNQQLPEAVRVAKMVATQVPGRRTPTVTIRQYEGQSL